VKHLEREEIIRKIVEEKGKEAIPDLIKLLEDEDSKVREIAADALKALGEDVLPQLREYLKVRLDEDPFNDVSLLYAVDVLGELKDYKSIPILYELLEHYDEEAYQLIIYDALSKLGEGRKFLDLLEYLLLEDAYKENLKEQVIMILPEIEEQRSVEILVKAWKMYKEDMDTAELIMRAFELLVMRKPEFFRIIEDMDEELSRRLKGSTGGG